jgi:carbamoyl-phosphate synthase small subunit
MAKITKAQLVLRDGSCVTGEHFGGRRSISGEVVFNTGMVGYPEAMTDPSYKGQVLVLTYPLIGNYGVPVNGQRKAGIDGLEIPKFLESDRIQVSGLIVSTLSKRYSHSTALDHLDSWMQHHEVPGMSEVDTRTLTKKLRAHGTMLGKIVIDEKDISWNDPNERNVVAEVSVQKATLYPGLGEKKVILVDFGCKESILRHLIKSGLDVLRVPWNYDWSEEPADGLVLSNGPGDPKMCPQVLDIVRRGLQRDLPVMGICLGHQLLALAVGADTFKLKFGHRGQNQPCVQVGTRRCFITSQNHGFSVDEQTLPSEWQPWFFNANDGTNEGMRHRERPIYSVQFHPEANPGPLDTVFLLDSFINTVRRGH